MKALSLVVLVFLVLTIARGAGAQVESPGNLAANSGTGDPVLRVGSWDLERIWTTMLAGDRPRESLNLPVNTRSRSGLAYIKDPIGITASVNFLDLKKAVGANSAYTTDDPSLKVIVKTGTMTLDDGLSQRGISVQCNFDFTLASGEIVSPKHAYWNTRLFTIKDFLGTRFKENEFACGGPLEPSLKPGQDFTLNFKLVFTGFRGGPVEYTYHFLYQWAGWKNRSTPPPMGPAGWNSSAGTAAQQGGSFSGSGSSAPAGQRQLARPQKTVFGVGEGISVDYYNAQGRGWDWIVITQPSRRAQATGEHGAVTPAHSLRFNPNDNSTRELAGTANFPPLPEGEYEVHYISWDGGNNRSIHSVPFKVGKAPEPPAQSPPSAGPPATGGPPSPADTSFSGDLSGIWRNPGGNAVYRFRQIGNKLHWGVDAVPVGSFANVFQGEVKGRSIEGSWTDLPGSPYLGGGRLFLRIESECRVVKTSEVNHYAAQVWVRRDSLCDVVGLQQQSAASAKTQTMPKVEEIPGETAPDHANRPEPAIRVTGDPSGVFSDPKAAGTASQRTANKPVVEEIPDDTEPERISPASKTSPPAATAAGSNPTSTRTVPQQQPSANTGNTSKPKGSDGGFWGRLGTAINQAATANQRPQAPPTQTGQGGAAIDPTNCRGGVWALGPSRPSQWRLGTPGEGIRIAFSTPIGKRSILRVFRAGTSQQETWGHNPDHPNFCGLSWSIYPSTEGYFDFYLYETETSTTPVAGPYRVLVYR